MIDLYNVYVQGRILKALHDNWRGIIEDIV